MDYIIQFIGIILIVNSTGRGVPYRALVPMSSGTETFCEREDTVPVHETYLRIQNGDLDAATSWPNEERVACDTAENCTLFRISKASTLAVDSGFDPGIDVHERASYCLVPQLAAEVNSKISKVKESGALVKMDLPGGDLTAEQLANGAVIARLAVPAPPAAAVQAQKLVVTVTDRDNAVRKVVLKPGSTITLLNANPEMAPKSIAARDPHASRHAHHLLFNNILPADTQICDHVGTSRPCGSHIPQMVPGGGVVGDFVCSVGGCCRPRP